MVIALFDGLVAAGGPIGGLLRRSLRCRLRPLEVGTSPEEVFPVPLLELEHRPRRGRRRLRVHRRRAVVALVNLLLAVLNLLHAGRAEEAFCEWQPSRAQQRVRSRVTAVATSFLREGQLLSGEVEHSDYLQKNHAYTGGAAPLAIGLRGGVPTTAGLVDLAALLDEDKPEYAKQVREPTALLAAPSDRPGELTRPFQLLADDYDQLVEENVKAGLQRMAPERAVFRHGGKPVINGAFAVAKNQLEDRIISACNPLNDMLNADLLPRPRFGLMSAIRATTTNKQRRLGVWKRDIRHYFHNLKVGRTWRMDRLAGGTRCRGGRSGSTSTCWRCEGA